MPVRSLLTMRGTTVGVPVGPGGDSAAATPPGLVLASAGNDQAGDVASDVVTDQAVADGNLADGISPSAGHRDVDGPVAIRDLDCEASERIGERHAIRVGIRPVGDGDPHAFLRLVGVAGL